jgi:hypothetical protein
MRAEPDLLNYLKYLPLQSKGKVGSSRTCDVGVIVRRPPFAHRVQPLCRGPTQFTMDFSPTYLVEGVAPSRIRGAWVCVCVVAFTEMSGSYPFTLSRLPPSRATSRNPPMHNTPLPCCILSTHILGGGVDDGVGRVLPPGKAHRVAAGSC